MRELAGPDGRPVTYAPEEWTLEEYKDRLPRLTDAVHLSNGEKCSAAWVAHVNADLGSCDLMVAHAPGELITVQAILRVDAPQLITVLPRVLSWHWPQLCPWRR